MAAFQLVANYSAVALTATTAKTVVGIKAPTNQCVKILEVGVSFDGATSTNTPALVEFCRCTFATNGPGTNSTSVTLGKVDPGRDETAQTTAGHTWTTEPTVITAFETKYVGQFNGLLIHIHPFTAPWLVIGGQGFVIRITSPNNVNTSGHILFEE